MIRAFAPARWVADPRGATPTGAGILPETPLIERPALAPQERELVRHFPVEFLRPVFHHRDDTTIGHIVGCFLALRLEVDLQRRLDERGVDVAWPDLMRDLADIREVELTLDGHRYRLRTELRGSAFEAFAAGGVRPPSLVTPLGAVPEPPAAGEVTV